MQASEYTISPLQHVKGISIFFAYRPDARKDKNVFRALKKHLVSLIAEGRIRELYDSAVEMGKDWRRSIEAYISNADIIVLLVSAEFMASDFCREVEMKQALLRDGAGEARVLAICLHPFDWTGLPLDPLHQIPPDGKPISDWRDRDLALFEITKGIRKVVEELTSNFTHVFWRARGPNFPLIVLPYRLNPLFTGREDLLEKLHRNFILPGDTHIQALSGLGGMGKTQIAIEYAYRYEDEYDSILWVNASSYDLLCSDVLSLADQLYLPDTDRIDERHVLVAVKRWLQRQQRWLLVLDDIDDFNLIDLIVPSQYSGHVLLTTRSQATGTIARALTVGPMTGDEGALFLLRRAKIVTELTTREDIPPPDYAQALSLVQALDGFPLALDQAGAYIEETRKKPAEYLELYRERQIELLQRRGHFSNGHPQSVAAIIWPVCSAASSSTSRPNRFIYGPWLSLSSGMGPITRRRLLPRWRMLLFWSGEPNPLKRIVLHHKPIWANNLACW
jgi:hypothetical protein